VLLGSSWYIAVLARADTRAAPASSQQDPPLVTDSSGGISLAVSTSGVRARTTDSGGAKTTEYVAFPATTWTLVEAWYDGADLRIASNGGTPEAVAVGALTSPSGRTLILGESPFTNYFDGQIAEVMIAASVPDSTDRANIKAYLEDRYD